LKIRINKTTSQEIDVCDIYTMMGGRRAAAINHEGKVIFTEDEVDTIISVIKVMYDTIQKEERINEYTKIRQEVFGDSPITIEKFGELYERILGLF